MAAIGVQHLVNADFVAVILPSFPAWAPWRPFWFYSCSLGLIAAGAAICAGWRTRSYATVLGSALLVLILLVDIPNQAATAMGSLGAWNNTLKALTLSGGAFAVAASPSPEANPWDRPFVSFGCYAMALTVAIFGVEHFLYAAFVADLVPSWIPWHLFWTYFCGAALVAAGAGMALNVRARLAANLLGSIIFIWLLVLHIPRAVADPVSGHGNEWTSVCEALSFSGICLVLGSRLPGAPGSR